MSTMPRYPTSFSSLVAAHSTASFSWQIPKLDAGVCRALTELPACKPGHAFGTLVEVPVEHPDGAFGTWNIFLCDHAGCIGFADPVVQSEKLLFGPDDQLGLSVAFPRGAIDPFNDYGQIHFLERLDAFRSGLDADRGRCRDIVPRSQIKQPFFAAQPVNQGAIRCGDEVPGLQRRSVVGSKDGSAVRPWYQEASASGFSSHLHKVGHGLLPGGIVDIPNETAPAVSRE
jgi:hypothetical protein